MSQAVCYDLSQKHAHGSSTAARIQAKKVLGNPGDAHEQEADRIASQVMGMAAPGPRRQCACGGGCPRCRSEQGPGAHLQAKQAQANVTGQAISTPVVDEVLRSAGQTLEPATQEFMGSRFGHDFSHVRIHADAKAAESAKSIDAHAYTSGNHIAFDTGQYSPATDVGKWLLAHELAHTLQQGDGVLHRKYKFTTPKADLSDPIPLVLGGHMLGNTHPKLNGAIVPDGGTLQSIKSHVFNILQPAEFKFSTKGGAKNCKVKPDKYVIDVSARLKAIVKPKKGKWTGSYAHSIMNNAPSVCSAAPDPVKAELTGKPDSNALYKKVRTHENEHVADLKKIAKEELKTYHDFLLGLQGSGADDATCVSDIIKQVGTRDADAADKFVDKWLAAVQVYDKPGGTHHSNFQTNIQNQCANLTITEV